MTTNQDSAQEEPSSPLSTQQIIRTWWPLAASWLLMAVEVPALSAFIARLAEPKTHLAAFGSIVYPLALLIEAPLLMLLSASTALSKDWDSYVKVHRFMTWGAAALTAVYVLITFTPLYYFVVGQLIAAPDEIVEPARLGMMLMVPWAWAIGYRRFNQGILIRFGHSRAVGLGTLIRMLADGAIATVGFLIGTIPGAAVASAALAIGVTSEAIYAGLRARPIVRNELRQAPPVEKPITLRGFIEFYTPLALTSIFYLLVQPLGSAALSRMPEALDSLAAWPVVAGFLFILRSLGLAFNEVVIALLDKPRSVRSLRRFAGILTGLTTFLLVLFAATPLGTIWFGQISGLPPTLVTLARWGLWASLPIPGSNVLQSWYQGTVVHSRRTRGVTEAVGIYLLASAAILGAGVIWQGVPGLYVGAVAFSVGRAAQTAWLWKRSRPAMRSVEERDACSASLPVADACTG